VFEARQRRVERGLDSVLDGAVRSPVVFGRDYRQRYFAKIEVRYPDHRRFGNSRHCVEDGLDLLGVDVLAAADDHVARPAMEAEPSGFVKRADIAGHKPLTLQVRLGGGVGPTPVFAH